MQKFDHVLLASDFDNTLVYTQSALDNGTDIPPMCPRNREALDYFIQNGGLFAISTGRALPAFMDYAKDVPMSAPCVIANGAAIYDFRANEYLYTAFLGKAIYDHMAEVLARFPTLAFEVYHDDCRIHAMNPNRYIRNHEHLTRSPVQVVERFTDIDLPIIKILFEEDFPVLDAVRTFILSRPWGREYELIYSNEHLLELTAAGATKGGMILRVASLLGVAQLHVHDGVRHVLRLLRVQRKGLGGFYGAIGAGARAPLPGDHESGRALVPAFVAVGAVGFFTDGEQVLAFHKLLDVPEFPAVGQAHLDPGRLAFRPFRSLVVVPVFHSPASLP